MDGEYVRNVANMKMPARANGWVEMWQMWQIPTANGMVVYMINAARRKVLEGPLMRDKL